MHDSEMALAVVRILLGRLHHRERLSARLELMPRHVRGHADPGGRTNRHHSKNEKTYPLIQQMKSFLKDESVMLVLLPKNAVVGKRTFVRHRLRELVQRKDLPIGDKDVIADRILARQLGTVGKKRPKSRIADEPLALERLEWRQLSALPTFALRIRQKHAL